MATAIALRHMKDRSGQSRPIASTPRHSEIPEGGTIGRLIYDAMLTRGQTEVDLARHFKMNQSSVHRWITNENNPSDQRLPELADFLGVTLEEVWLLKHRRAEMPTTLTVVEDRLSRSEEDVASLREEMAALGVQVQDLAAALKLIQRLVAADEPPPKPGVVKKRRPPR